MTFIPEVQTKTDTNNSTTVTASTFSGTSTVTTGYNTIIVTIQASVNSSAGGIIVYMSEDNLTWTQFYTDTYFASNIYTKSFTITNKYWKLSYTSTSSTALKITSRLSTQLDTNSIISQSSDKELINRPHSQKWYGNNPEFDDFFSDQNADNGYTFYKALTPSDSPVKSQVGLNSVLDDVDTSLKPLSRVTSPTFKTSNHFSTLRKTSTYIHSQTECTHQSALQISMQSLSCDTGSDMSIESLMESEPTVVVHSPRKIKLTSSETTVHLSNLFNISYTLSPRGLHLENVLFRSQVKSDFSLLPIKNRKKKRIIKLSFGGMVSSSNSSVVSGAL
jgi:hypothetical protein